MTIVASISEETPNGIGSGLRMSTVWKRARQSGIILTPEVTQFLASLPLIDEKLPGFIDLCVTAALQAKKPLTTTIVREVIAQQRISLQRTRPEIIFEEISRITGFSKEEICGRRKFRELTLARRIVMVLLLLDGHSTTRTGRMVGGKDHSSVIYARKKLQSEVSTNPEVRKLLEDICSAINTRMAV